MVSFAAPSLTLEEFLAQPESKPAREYLDGEIRPKPMPKGKHSLLQGELATALNQSLRSEKKAWAFPELRCTFGGRSIVPDIAVITWDRIPVDEAGEIDNDVRFCPDWILEILSPDQSQTHLTRKILAALQSGCQMGWIVDPSERTVLVYPAHSSPTFFDLENPDQPIAVPKFAQGFQVSVNTLFGWMQIKG
ncbi:MAG: Uma2 family endonuclease [Cyanophyceae cyanobacterium]